MVRFVFAALVMVTATTTDPLQAGVIFDLRDQGTLFDNKVSESFTVGGITATLTASGGDLNSNLSQFGINAVGAGDDADAIESGESLTVTFDQDLFLTALDLQDFTGAEQMQLTIGANSVQTLSNSTTADVFTFSSANFLAQGESLLFAPSSGDFGIATFTVAAVPEPVCSAGLVFAAVLLAIGRTRRQRNRAV